MLEAASRLLPPYRVSARRGRGVTPQLAWGRTRCFIILLHLLLLFLFLLIFPLLLLIFPLPLIIFHLPFYIFLLIFPLLLFLGHD